MTDRDSAILSSTQDLFVDGASHAWAIPRQESEDALRFVPAFGATQKQKGAPSSDVPFVLFVCRVAVSAHMRLEVFATVTLAELAERLLLDLTDALAGQVEPLADLFERERVLAANAEVEAGDLGLTGM